MTLAKAICFVLAYAIFCGPTALAQDQGLDSTDAIKLNGIFSMGENSMFSLCDLESGQSYWLREGQAWGELKVIEYDRNQRSLEISWYGRRLGLKLQDTSGDPIEVIYSQTQATTELTEFNLQLLRDYKKLIKDTVSSESGRTIKNHHAQEQLRRFIRTNPSTPELNNFMFSELKDEVDMEEFFSLEFPKHVPNRSNRDTPGWDIKDDVTLEDIEALLASNATTQQIEDLKKVRD